jgi:hypothetical protein
MVRGSPTLLAYPMSSCRCVALQLATFWLTVQGERKNILSQLNPNYTTSYYY